MDTEPISVKTSSAYKTKIAIADDHTLFRKGIIELLDPDQYELMFDVANGNDVIEAIEKNPSLTPDIIIIDIGMPKMDGYETVIWLKENNPEIKVLIVSMVDNEEAIVKMLKLGVKGYLPKDIEPEDLRAALNAIINKNYYFTDFVTNKLIHTSTYEEPAQKLQNKVNEAWNSLNARQQEFVGYACSELTYKEIADKMCVSDRTIDGYRDAVFERLQVKNRTALVLFAIKNKIVNI